MTIGVVSYDNKNGIVTDALHEVIKNAYDLSLNYNFEFIAPDGVGDMYDKVNTGKYWGILAVNANASSNLMTAVLSTKKNIVYDYTTACTFWYDQGRAGASLQYAFASLGPTIINYMNINIKNTIIKSLTNNNYNVSNIVPTVLANPISVQVINIHPVINMGMHVAAGGGVMQFFLVSAIQTIAVIKLHSELEGRGIYPAHLFRLNVLHRIIGCFMIAFWPGLCLLILGIGTDVITANTFFTLWAFCWLVLTILCGIIYYVYKLLSIPVGFITAISLMMLMVASSNASLPFDAMPDFFQIGYALPFFNATQGIRAILFNSNFY